ncbi:hypothetical protein [Pseudomonas sp. zfem002]|uniref:hypothetical protein n=1 Tax=Pseudomonas sp. zfem002 TaxID=3078197 RepID=UPI002927BA45|nr:hypothetical protein [Pseudomonas sp. zfem002]MDU9393143.1 hypothetical protein [Pseudomonas sp. zfem002]
MADELGRDSLEQSISSTCKRVVAENFGALLKGVPLFIGFLIYFIYFCQISFFPSVDLFALTSLLVSAFLMGAALIVVVSLGLFFPGWSWADTCIKKENSIGTYFFGATGMDGMTASRFMLIWFALPLLLNTVLSVLSWKSHDESWSVTAIFIVIPLALPVVFGGWLKKVSGGTWSQIINYIVFTWLSLLCTNVACFIIGFTFLSSFEDWNGRVSPEAAVVGWSLGSLIVLANAAASRLSLRAGLAASLCLAVIALVAMRGTVVFPARMMAILGVGHYQSQKVLLKKETCETLSNSIPLVDGCAISKPWVVWGVGDVFKLRVAKGVSSESTISRPCGPHGGACQELILAKESVVAIIK